MKANEPKIPWRNNVGASFIIGLRRERVYSDDTKEMGGVMNCLDDEETDVKNRFYRDPLTAKTCEPSSTTTEI